uniref:25S rRNA (uridine-N(3))-methyltransferase BMT5-like domain-containing protein n=1 Tax=Kalanchoe fedtschenkoi TaxID=63787 RepID=A0A7N0U1Y5_KALFE
MDYSDHGLLDTQFDRIVFNFPHAGFLYPENNRSQIMLHRMLVKGFFKSASEMLTEGGEVHVTHKTGHPYDDWDIEELAEMSGLECVEEVGFYQFCYPGYENKRGDGSRCDRSFNIGSCSTFKFKIISASVGAQLQNLSFFDKVLC